MKLTETLSTTQQLAFIAKLVQSQCHETLNRWLWYFKLTSASRKTVDLSQLRIPDTALVKHSEIMVCERYSPVMYAHCQRTWQFAWVVAKAFDIRVDEEAFYIACLMHDLGLTEPCCQNIAHKGFQIIGAEESRHFLQAQGMNEMRCNRVYEAIVRHLHPGTSLKNSDPESFLLKVGAHMDVIGSYAHWIEHRNMELIHKAYPRQGFNHEIINTIEYFPHQPGSHAGILGRLGFAKLVKKNPLNQYEQ